MIYLSASECCRSWIWCWLAVSNWKREALLVLSSRSAPYEAGRYVHFTSPHPRYHLNSEKSFFGGINFPGLCNDTNEVVPKEFSMHRCRAWNFQRMGTTRPCSPRQTLKLLYMYVHTSATCSCLLAWRCRKLKEEEHSMFLYSPARD